MSSEKGYLQKKLIDSAQNGLLFWVLLVVVVGLMIYATTADKTGYYTGEQEESCTMFRGECL